MDVVLSYYYIPAAKLTESYPHVHSRSLMNLNLNLKRLELFRRVSPAGGRGETEQVIEMDQH